MAGGESKGVFGKNCGLNTERKIPGRVFETHDGALQFWQELIAAGQLSVPFEVTHIDAHSDLGIGRPGPGFVLNSVLPLSLRKERTSNATMK